MTVVDAAQIAEDLLIDILVDELYRAVGEPEVGPAYVIAAGRLIVPIVKPPRLPYVTTTVKRIRIEQSRQPSQSPAVVAR